jgi:Fe/S biogenesis protein NfuA
VIDELVNPRIAAHGGAVELVDVADDAVYVRMTGGCQGCSASAHDAAAWGWSGW